MTTCLPLPHLRLARSNSSRPHSLIPHDSTSSNARPNAGTTLHSALGIGVPSVWRDFDKMWAPRNRKIWRDIEVLIIDEVGSEPPERPCFSGRCTWVLRLELLSRFSNWPLFLTVTSSADLS